MTKDLESAAETAHLQVLDAARKERGASVLDLKKPVYVLMQNYDPTNSAACKKARDNAMIWNIGDPSFTQEAVAKMLEAIQSTGVASVTSELIFPNGEAIWAFADLKEKNSVIERAGFFINNTTPDMQNAEAYYRMATQACDKPTV